jgi:hypothetical protein
MPEPGGLRSSSNCAAGHNLPGRAGAARALTFTAQHRQERPRLPAGALH